MPDGCDVDAGISKPMPKGRRGNGELPPIRKPRGQRRIEDCSLIGQSGVALVEFQLARRGHQCIRMPPGCPSGDMWAETALGRVSIEVKATERGRSWFVRMNQTVSEVYVFVYLEDAECYILTKDEVASLIAARATPSDGVCKIQQNWFPKHSYEGWSRLGASAAPDFRYMKSQIRRA